MGDDGFDIVVVGSCMIDLISYAPRLPKSGETLHGSKFLVGFGGKGCNQCVAAQKLGAKTLLVARVGDDSFGRDYVKQLTEYGIPTNHVGITPNVSSGMAQITVAETGENQIVIVAGANNMLTECDVTRAEIAIAECGVLVCQMETPPESTLRALQIKKQSRRGISILNVAPAQENLDPKLYSLPTILCVNETEAELLTGLGVADVAEAKRVAGELVERGCEEAIITLGALGAVWVTRNNKEAIHVAATPVIPVDTTGAGDSFIGALAYYLARNGGRNSKEIIQKACEVATISVGKRGTQTSFPDAHELPPHLRK